MEHITNGVYVGSINDANPVAETPAEPSEFDHVISLGDAVTPYTTENYDIGLYADDAEPFFEAVNRVRQLLRKEDVTAFVHCQVGSNRVVAVTATALSAETDEWDFWDAVECLDEASDVDLHDTYRDMAERYLELTD